jgi:hypothetical protein
MHQCPENHIFAMLKILRPQTPVSIMHGSLITHGTSEGNLSRYILRGSSHLFGLNQEKNARNNVEEL